MNELNNINGGLATILNELKEGQEVSYSSNSELADQFSELSNLVGRIESFVYQK